MLAQVPDCRHAVGRSPPMSSTLRAGRLDVVRHSETSRDQCQREKCEQKLAYELLLRVTSPLISRHQLGPPHERRQAERGARHLHDTAGDARTVHLDEGRSRRPQAQTAMPAMLEAIMRPDAPAPDSKLSRTDLERLRRSLPDVVY